MDCSICIRPKSKREVVVVFSTLHKHSCDNGSFHYFECVLLLFGSFFTFGFHTIVQSPVSEDGNVVAPPLFNACHVDMHSSISNGDDMHSAFCMVCIHTIAI